MNGWDPSIDSLTGTEKYGDSSDNTKAWAIQYNSNDFTKYKIESCDGSYCNQYNKDELIGKTCDSEQLLGSSELLRKYKGANVYIMKCFSADNVIDGNSSTYSQTESGDGEYWTAQFVSGPKKVGVDSIRIRYKDDLNEKVECGYKISIDG